MTEDVGQVKDTTEPPVEDVVEPTPDAKPTADTGCSGYWEPCCLDGEVSECCCPEGVACNFGWFQPCEDNKCTFAGGMCPEEM